MLLVLLDIEGKYKDVLRVLDTDDLTVECIGREQLFSLFSNGEIAVRNLFRTSSGHIAFSSADFYEQHLSLVLNNGGITYVRVGAVDAVYFKENRVNLELKECRYNLQSAYRIVINDVYESEPFEVATPMSHHGVLYMYKAYNRIFMRYEVLGFRDVYHFTLVFDMYGNLLAILSDVTSRCANSIFHDEAFITKYIVMGGHYELCGVAK